jgi:hypothetical protein
MEMRATTENLNVSSPSLQRIHSVLGFYETVQGTTLSFLVNLENCKALVFDCR